MLKPEPKSKEDIQAQADSKKKGCGCGKRNGTTNMRVDDMTLEQRKRVIARRIAKRTASTHPDKAKRIFL